MPVSGNSVVMKAPRLVPGTFLLRDQVLRARPLLTDGSPISRSPSCSRIRTF